MATSYDTYKKQYLKDKNEDKIIDINAVQNQAEQQKQAVQESYNTGIAETQSSYENAFRQNEVQRALNERFLERKAAEMGLTDSGMNRTQQTANQLSYGNQKATLTTQKQKAMDTLAAAMRAKMADIDTAEAAQVRVIEKQYDANAEQYATNRYNADLEAASKANQAIVDASEKYYSYTDPQSGETKITSLLKDDRNDAFDRVKETLPDVNSDYEKAQLIKSFVTENHATNSEIQLLLQAAGIDESKLYAERWTANEYVAAKKSGKDIPDTVFVESTDWDAWRNEGKQTYKVVLTKATGNLWDWLGWGKNSNRDTDDMVSIYYPDGTLMVENIKIGDLPKSKNEYIQVGMTQNTAGQKEGHTFEFEADFSDRVGVDGWKLSKYKE